jgi:hypothetical protein
LSSKIKDSNTFKQNLSWGKTKINLNKHLEDFLNLKLFKISLNIQIQTKALNERLLNRFKKDFEMKFKCFQKTKLT